jgi:hypothetical protein
MDAIGLAKLDGELWLILWEKIHKLGDYDTAAEYVFTCLYYLYVFMFIVWLNYVCLHVSCYIFYETNIMILYSSSEANIENDESDILYFNMWQYINQ